MELKLRHGVAVAGIGFGLLLIGVDASNGVLFDPASKGIGFAGVATAATFGLTAVVK